MYCDEICRPGNSKSSFLRRGVLWGALFSLTTLFACTSPFTEVRRKDNIDAYKDFIRQNPQSPDRKAAEERLDTLSFRRASEDNSEESYGNYLREFPQGLFRRQARTQIEVKAYQRARDRDTLESYRAFLQRFPQGQFAREAKERVEDQFFRKAIRYASVRGLEAYLKHFPKGRYRQQAIDKHRDIWWTRLQKNPTIRGYENFVRRFQEGLHVADARQKILLLRYESYELSGKWWLLKGWIKANPDSPMQERARKHMKIFRNIYPSLERARRLAESGEPTRAAMVYRSLYQRYSKRYPIVVRVLQKDLKKHKIPMEQIQ